MGATDQENAPQCGSEPVGEHVRIYRRGTAWYANFQHGRKQHRVSLKTKSKKEARLRALKIDAEISRGTWASVRSHSIAEGVDAYTSYLRSEGRAPKTLTKYSKIFERVLDLAVQFKAVELSRIDLRFIDEYRSRRMIAGAQLTTRSNEIVVIRQLVNFALSRDMLPHDPLKGLKLKKPRPERQPCWTQEEVQRILVASPIDIRPALIILAETGLRFGELAWLRWDDVDWSANVLRVQPKEGWKPKTGDQRAIPLSDTAIELLKSLPQQYGWVVTMPRSRKHPKPGRQWTERRLLSGLKSVLKRLALPGKLHTFRHYFISNALLKGVPVAVVREWVGHVDDAVIKLYTHVHHAASQSAMQRLADANQVGRCEAKLPQNNGTSPAQTQHSNKEEKNG